MTKRDEMLKAAEAVARLLLLEEVLGVAKVGLFGSLARGEEDPSDIDLIALMKSDGIPERILEEMKGGESFLYDPGDDAPADLREICLMLEVYFGAPDEFIERVDALLCPEAADLVVMPEELSEDYLGRFAEANHDPMFLEHTAEDFRLFDPESGHFHKAEAPWKAFLEAEAEERRRREEELERLDEEEWGHVGSATSFGGPPDYQIGAIEIETMHDVYVVLNRLEHGDRLIMIFRLEGKTEIPYLLGMLMGGRTLEADSNTQATLWEVMRSGYWDHESNRVITVTPTDSFDPRWFADRLYRALEWLEVVRGEGTIAQRLLMDESDVPLEQIRAAVEKEFDLELSLAVDTAERKLSSKYLNTRARMIYRSLMNYSAFQTG